MAAAARVHQLLILAIISALLGPSHSLDCTSQKLSGSRVYANCSDLPQLGAILHYTYNQTNSSLSVAFTAAPASGGAWISWAINPRGTKMVGSQALVAMKLSGGKVAVKTYNITGYHSLIEGKLDFEFWNLSAEDNNGTLTIFASVKVPEKAESVNQVWQVGGKVNGSDPLIHPMDKPNMGAMSVLRLATSANGSSPTPAPSGKKNAAARPSGLGLISGLAMLLVGSIVM